MTITIIIPCFNSARTIEETLESIQKQSYNNIQLIVVDGGSTDVTLQILKKYSSLIDQQISEQDNGIYDAMNKGIARATGDVIGILNSDDFYVNENVIAKVAEAFVPGIDAVYGDLQYVDQLNTDKVIRTWKSGNYSRNDFLFGWMPPHPTFFVRKEVYQQLGNFNTALRSAADYEFMLRVLFKNQLKAAYIPEVLVRMRAGGVSNASFRNRVNANKEDRLAWKLNGLQPYFFTLYLKPVRKILQYIIR